MITGALFFLMIVIQIITSLHVARLSITHQRQSTALDHMAWTIERLEAHLAADIEHNDWVPAADGEEERHG